MKVLHISGDFIATKVHRNLYKKLDDIDVSQVIYSPIRDVELFGSNQFEANDTEFIYSYVIKSWYKFIFYYKSHVIFQDVKKKINFEDIDIIHATTLFSDGVLAYKIHKERNIPYVIAVRNTDINLFSKFLPHTWPIAKKILLNTERIYFISKALQDTFEQLSFVRPILNKIKNKIVLRPNGIDNQWLDRIDYSCRKGNKILYIGNFSPNKNVCRLIESISLLRKENGYTDMELTIIGGGSDKNNKVTKLIKSNNHFVKYLGKIYDIPTIRNIMQEHTIFAMPSIYETFGLVYIEALTQNLPILYTNHQGVDRLFDDNKNPVGIGVNPLSVQDIKNAIKKLLEGNGKYSNKQVDFSIFNFDIIAKKYKNDYQDIINSKQS